MSINAVTGLYTATEAPGSYTVRASVGSISGIGIVTVPPVLLNYTPGAVVSNQLFTRASAAQYYDVNGIVQTAASGTLRDSHYVGAVRTTLLEPSRTNLLLYSRDLTNAGGWYVLNPLTRARNAVGIDGTANTATTLTTDGASSQRAVQDIIVSQDIRNSCLSVWIKKDTNQTRFPMVHILRGAVEVKVRLNTQTGASYTFASTGTTTQRVVDAGLWWILEIVSQNNSTIAYEVQIYPANSLTLSGAETGAIASSIIVGHFQLEHDASFHTTPIYTSGAAVTRAADNLGWQGFTTSSGTLTQSYYDSADVLVSGEASSYVADNAIIPPVGRRYTSIVLAGTIARSNTALENAIMAQQVARVGTNILYSGEFSGGTILSGSNRTYLNVSPANRVRQDGYIRRVSFLPGANAGSAWKLKVFRANGANFDFVGESEGFTPWNAAVVQTFDLATPVACQIGDYVALYIPTGGTVYLTANANAAAKYAAGDISASNAFASTDGAYYLSVGVYGRAPFIVGAGDSIQAGHALYENVNDAADAFSGNIDAQPLEKISATVPTVDYQNQGFGGQDWPFMAGRTATINAIGSRAIWYHCGVNDAILNHSVASVLANLDTIKASLTAGVKLIVTEVLPCTNASDAAALRIREYNTAFATWCASNSATFVVCHDTFGLLRASTSQLDDLKVIYSGGDGTHLNVAGAQALGALVEAAMETMTW